MSKDLSLNNLRYVYHTYNAEQPMDAYYQPFIKAFFTGVPPNAGVNTAGDLYFMFALKDIPTSAYSTTTVPPVAPPTDLYLLSFHYS